MFPLQELRKRAAAGQAKRDAAGQAKRKAAGQTERNIAHGVDFWVAAKPCVELACFLNVFQIFAIEVSQEILARVCIFRVHPMAGVVLRGLWQGFVELHGGSHPKSVTAARRLAASLLECDSREEAEAVLLRVCANKHSDCI